MSNGRLIDQVQPHHRTAPPYAAVQPPDALATSLGVPVESIDKLDANENPFGPSPKALEALAAFDGYNIYPDPAQLRLREALGAYVGYGPEWILAGSGSDEVIELATRLFVPAGGKALSFPPTFGMYSFLAATFGQGVVEVTRKDDFSLDIEGALAAAREASLIFVTSPNNPSGNRLQRDELEALLETELPVVVDEAYAEFDGQSYVSLVREKSNLAVARTLSKWAGLAGLRLGYLVCDPAVIEISLRIKQPYNVSLAAEIAALAALEDRPLLEERIQQICAERDRIAIALAAMPGLTVYPSRGNFLLCRVEQMPAKELHSKLRDYGIMVRFYDTPLLQNHVRISAGRADQTERLLKALAEVLSQAAGTGRS